MREQGEGRKEERGTEATVTKRETAEGEEQTEGTQSEVLGKRRHVARVL